MSTEIRLWEVTNGRLSPLNNRKFADNRKEKDLETWIAQEPSLLGRPGLTILGQQVPISSVGPLDLLASDGDSGLIVVEFKRQQSTRDTIAQILDYASALENMDREQLRSLLNVKHDDVLFESEDPIEIKMIVVAADADQSVQRIVNYLASKAGLSIEVITFTYACLEDGREIIARSIFLPDDMKRAGEPREQTRLSELLRIASEKGVTAILDILRQVTKLDWQEHPVSSYGGSLRYPIAAPPDNRARVLFGINVAGKLKPPHGSLDVWVRPEIAAAYSEASIENVSKELSDFNQIRAGYDGNFIRISDTATADKLLKLLEQWDSSSAEFRAKQQAKAN